MEITEVRVRHVQDSTDRLKAFCTVTFDDQFVVRDIKVVEGSNGLFVSMPSRKATAACGKCNHRNQIRARFCEDCGARMGPQESAPVDANGRSKLHRDIAHPITPEFRELLQARVLDAFMADQENAPQGDHEQDDDMMEAPVEKKAPIARVAPAPKVQPVVEVEDEDEEDRQPQRLVSEYDDLIAGLRGMPEGNREPRGRTDDRGNGGRGNGDRRGGERPRSDSRPNGDRAPQGDSRPRGPAPRSVSNDRGRAPREGDRAPRDADRGPREGDRAPRGRDAGPARPAGGEGVRRGRDVGPPRRTGCSQGVKFLRDEQPPRSPGSVPHGERMGENRPPQREGGREPVHEPVREPARDVAPREMPRETARSAPRDVPKGPPPKDISLKEADQRYAVDAGGEEEDAPFGAGL